MADVPSVFPAKNDVFTGRTLDSQDTPLSSSGGGKYTHPEDHTFLGNVMEAMQRNIPTLDHDHSGEGLRPTPKLRQTSTHENPDTDSSSTSLHHTLGKGPLQAASGDHNHTNPSGRFVGDNLVSDPLLDGPKDVTVTPISSSSNLSGRVLTLGGTQPTTLTLNSPMWLVNGREYEVGLVYRTAGVSPTLTGFSVTVGTHVIPLTTADTPSSAYKVLRREFVFTGATGYHTLVIGVPSADLPLLIKHILVRPVQRNSLSIATFEMKSYSGNTPDYPRRNWGGGITIFPPWKTPFYEIVNYPDEVGRQTRLKLLKTGLYTFSVPSWLRHTQASLWRNLIQLSVFPNSTSTTASRAFRGCGFPEDYTHLSVSREWFTAGECLELSHYIEGPADYTSITVRSTLQFLGGN